MICSIGKPPKADTFGDLADVFIGAVLEGGTLFKQIDVVFDRYCKKSIKEGMWPRISGDPTFDRRQESFTTSKVGYFHGTQ